VKSLQHSVRETHWIKKEGYNERGGGRYCGIEGKQKRGEKRGEEK